MKNVKILEISRAMWKIYIFCNKNKYTQILCSIVIDNVNQALFYKELKNTATAASISVLGSSLPHFKYRFGIPKRNQHIMIITNNNNHEKHQVFVTFISIFDSFKLLWCCRLLRIVNCLYIMMHSEWLSYLPNVNQNIASMNTFLTVGLLYMYIFSTVSFLISIIESILSSQKICKLTSCAITTAYCPSTFIPNKIHYTCYSDLT